MRLVLLVALVACGSGDEVTLVGPPTRGGYKWPAEISALPPSSFLDVPELVVKESATGVVVFWERGVHAPVPPGSPSFRILFFPYAAGKDMAQQAFSQALDDEAKKHGAKRT